MLGAWILYGLAWAAHLGVGGLALWHGKASARLSVLVIALALACEQLALGFDLSPVPISYLWLEIGTNFTQCLGFGALALRFRNADWLIVMLLIKSTELGLDGLVLQSDPKLSHAFLPQVSDAISVLMMTVLAWGMSQEAKARTNGVVCAAAVLTDRS